jgi:hypothetical protein
MVQHPWRRSVSTRLHGTTPLKTVSIYQTTWYNTPEYGQYLPDYMVQHPWRRSVSTRLHGTTPLKTVSTYQTTWYNTPEDGQYLPDYMVQHPWRRSSLYSLLWELEISLTFWVWVHSFVQCCFTSSLDGPNVLLSTLFSNTFKLFSSVVWHREIKFKYRG